LHFPAFKNHPFVELFGLLILLKNIGLRLTKELYSANS
jgi:hypothetical protein